MATQGYATLASVIRLVVVVAGIAWELVIYHVKPLVPGARGGYRCVTRKGTAEEALTNCFLVNHLLLPHKRNFDVASH